MKTCLIIGVTGFIGAAIANEARARNVDVYAVNRANYAEYVGRSFDLLINANGNSKKYLDRRDPLTGFDLSVRSVLSTFQDFSCDHYVHLSSGAVYPDESNPDNNSEAEILDPATMTSAYGFHKWLAEQIVVRNAPRYTILRLGGFVGPGLSKNAIYDLLTGNPLFVHPDSLFQMMDTRDMARLLFELLDIQKYDQELFNLSSSGTVSVRQAAAWADASLQQEDETRPLVRAELNVSKAAVLLHLPESRDTVRRFIQDVKSGKEFLA